MELISKKSIKNLLKQYQIRPSKKLGQNFLIDKGVIKKFIKACDFKEKDTILEIGPGIGFTAHLLFNYCLVREI